MHVLAILPAHGCRRWQVEAVARLAAAGNIVSIRHAAAKTLTVRGLDAVLTVESRRFGRSLASPCEPVPVVTQGSPQFIIDLAGETGASGAPVLTIEFCGENSFPAGLEAIVADGRPAQLTARIDGGAIACARPMIRDRLWLTRTSDDLLAGAISLVVQSVGRFCAGTVGAIDGARPSIAVRKSFLRHYPWFLGTGMAKRFMRKRALASRPFYWQVAYRLLDGPGITETGCLDGPPFTVLPDDGLRFFADPFVIERDGAIYLFVEEFVYAVGRGVISVAKLLDDGTFETPKPVLQESHHLSYPQVFAHDGDVYVIPESAAAREVVLYRAVRFPDTWVRDTVLIAGQDINDATLLDYDGRLWLIGTQRFGYGSASDTMIAYSAANLRGPWSAHALNPVVIHHSAARPGGAFIRQGNRITLPVQDGSESYGGGLSLMRLERLDDDDVLFSAPCPILPGSAWARKGIHTLNRSGRVEVVDSAG